jgi:DNA topoisomerase VI subunit A
MQLTGTNFLCASGEVFGNTPQDIVDYKLPTHLLKDMGIKRARDANKNDLFIRHYREWIHAIEHMLKIGVRAEQQALAKHGLNHDISTYLLEKLRHPDRFLP